MKTILQQLQWQFVLLYKNRLITISVLITAVYGMIFYFIRDLPNVEPFLTLLIYNDPAIIGMFFIGLGIIMETNDNILPALFVTPQNHHIYLISRIIALSIVGSLCAAGMTAAMLGLGIEWLSFFMGVFGTCVIFSLAGIYIVSFTREFLPFMLRSIPVLFLLSLPLLNYFGLTDLLIFELMPLMGPLNLTVHSFGTGNDMISVFASYVSIGLWTSLLYYVVYRVFTKKVINSD